MSRETEFRALFGDHYASVAKYVLARGYQAADADDLIAGTFEVAWRRLDAVPSGRDAIPWLLTVARNLSHNAHRKARHGGSCRLSTIPRVTWPRQRRPRLMVAPSSSVSCAPCVG